MSNQSSRSIIYYTDNQIGEPMMSICQKYIAASNLPITSCSLQPINFGRNIVLKDGARSYPTMVKQIITALENSVSDYVFFCEHDVLYHPSHFDFTPPSDNIYYYNINHWRWDFPNNRAIQYDGMISLSQLCVDRKLALNHFKLREYKIKEMGLDDDEAELLEDPQWSINWGYEPGIKKIREEDFDDNLFAIRESKYPNIDIRHKGTFTKSKTTLDCFSNQPAGWKEIKIPEIPGWENILKVFNL
jgi:hypothetical protein